MTLPRNHAAIIVIHKAAFSTGRSLGSNVGRKPVQYDPHTVQLLFKNTHPTPSPTEKPPSKHAVDRRDPYLLRVTGPLGTLERSFPAFVRLTTVKEEKMTSSSQTTKEDVPSSASPDVPPPSLSPATASVTVRVDFPKTEKQKAMWGTARAHLANMVHGVTVGWKSTLRLVGVGYRAAIVPLSNQDSSRTSSVPPLPSPSTGLPESDPTRQAVQLRLGYANLIEVPIPEEVQAVCPSPDCIELSSPNKEIVKQLAATIRSYKPPEPYKQKGIFVDGETIQKKVPKKR